MRYPLKAILTALMVICLMSFGAVVMAQDATEEPSMDETESVEPMTEEPALEVATETPQATLLAPQATEDDPAATDEADETLEVYRVQPGDTLLRIARRFGTTVSALVRENGIVNPNLIYVGQRLRIPGTSGTATATAQPSTPIPTPTPQPTETYRVQPGDTLFRIAIRNNTTVSRLVALNNISNPNIIYTGQLLRLPVGDADADEDGDAAATPAPTTAGATAEPTQTPTQEGEVIDPGFAYGVVVFTQGQDVSALAQQAANLEMDWVKVYVRWRDLEPEQGNIDFATLDAVVDALDSQGLNILFTVTTSPDWARSSSNPNRMTTEARAANLLTEEGPPDDFDTYGDFVGRLAERYAGRVDAYEIWDEPNLGREWSSGTHDISAASYVDLLTVAYNAIKAADPNALVIVAGLAPTGFNDGINAIADRVYLQNLYDNDVIEVSDALAAHPGGWANPPDTECCDAPPGVETHYESPTFFFRDTLTDYRAIMLANGDNRPLWVTKFGWGTAADTNPPSQSFVFINYTDLEEQAIYTPRAFQLADELGFVGPMFLYNLNGCVARPDSAEACFYSMTAPGGQSRPVYDSVQNLERE